MQALQITAPGQTRIIELEPPTPQDGEVLLQVRRVGFCGSDLSTFEGRNPLVSYPRIPGHEIGATIAALGAGVGAEWPVGQPVTVVPYSSCGDCPSCRRGRAHACRSNRTLGVQREGGMCSYLVVPAEKLVRVDGLGARELSLVEPLTVGFHAVSRGEVTRSDTVAVFGCGVIGLGAIAGATERGARVIAVDLDDEKLALAQRLGARSGLNAAQVDVPAALRDLTQGDGPDVCIEAVGHPRTYQQAVDAVAFTGRVVCIGYAKEDVPLPTRLFVQKELDIRGSRNATAADFQRVAQYLAAADFPYERIISREVELGEAGAALAAWSADPRQVTKISVCL